MFACARTAWVPLGNPLPIHERPSRDHDDTRELFNRPDWVVSAPQEIRMPLLWVS